MNDIPASSTTPIQLKVRDSSDANVSATPSSTIPMMQANLFPTPNSEIKIKKEKLESLQKECSNLMKELDINETSDTDIRNNQRILKKHIRQLNRYNELKDVALSLVSLIADQKQVSIKAILEEMNVDDNDDGNTITKAK